jgi:uroporphyrinogen III methyltransferase/synthase
MVLADGSGIVYLVGAGPGDPSLITLRGVECLQRADVVVYDRLIGRLLLAHAQGAELIDVGKQPHCHVVPQDEINAILIQEARAGKVVVRLKGGDPFVFGRGGEEATALAEAGVPFEIVPGVTSGIAAPAFAGIPVTHRGVSCSLAIITGHRADGCADEPACDWARLAQGPDTLVFLMGFQSLPRLVEQLVVHGRSPDTPVAVIERATFPRQRTVVGTLATIVEQAAGMRPPIVIVVGEVVRLRETLRWFDLPGRRPLLGLRVLNTLPAPRAADLSRQLWALGAESVELPTLRVVPADDTNQLDAAVEALATHGAVWEWIVFAGPEGVNVFVDRLLALGHDVRVFAGTRLAALDQLTAGALRRHGLVADCVAGSGDGHEFAADVDGTASHRALVVDAALASLDVVGKLRAHDATVEVVNVHRGLPAEPNPAALSALLERRLDMAVFAAAHSLRGLAAMLGDRTIGDVLSGIRVACADCATADAARSLGVRTDAVAETPTVDGLAQAVVRVSNLAAGS